MKEIWKDVKNYEGLYQVNNFGKVKSLSKTIIRNNGRKQSFKSKVLKEGLSKNGYLSVSLFKNKNGKTYNIHKIVAQAFIPNPNKLPCINHKDGNKLNNNVDNLEWCDYSYNGKEAYRLGLNKAYWKNKKSKDNPSSKKVYQYKDNKLIKIWDCLTDTKRIGGFNSNCVSYCCLGTQKQHKGYKWAYEKI